MRRAAIASACYERSHRVDLRIVSSHRWTLHRSAFATNLVCRWDATPASYGRRFHRRTEPAELDYAPVSGKLLRTDAARLDTRGVMRRKPRKSRRLCRRAVAMREEKRP
jgi:hypothetical protein